MNGVIYLLGYSHRHAEALLCSMWSLRRFYDGPITVFTGDQALSDVRTIAQAIEASIIELGDCSYWKHVDCYAAKPVINLASPYHQTVYLDADTLIKHPIDELFDYELAFTQSTSGSQPMFLNSPGIHARRRRKQLLNIDSRLRQFADDARRNGVPAINTGVYSFRKEHELIRKWPIVHARCFATASSDETSLALLLAQYSPMILDDSWNCMPYYRQATEVDKIIHMPSKSWRSYPEWNETFELACKDTGWSTAVSVERHSDMSSGTG